MVLQAMSANDSHAKIDRKTHDAAVEAKEQLEQHVHDLQRRLQENDTALADLQTKLSSAATELDEMRAEVCTVGSLLSVIHSPNMH